MSIPRIHEERVCVHTWDKTDYNKHSNFHKHQRMHNVEFFGENFFPSSLHEEFRPALTIRAENFFQNFYREISATSKIRAKNHSENYLKK